MIACGSRPCRRLWTRTRSRRSRVAASWLSALRIAVGTPSRDAATAVITAPPPMVAWKVSVFTSSPSAGRPSRPTKTRSSKASPAVSSRGAATPNCNSGPGPNGMRLAPVLRHWARSLPRLQNSRLAATPGVALRAIFSADPSSPARVGARPPAVTARAESAGSAGRPTSGYEESDPGVALRSAGPTTTSCLMLGTLQAGERFAPCWQHCHCFALTGANPVPLGPGPVGTRVVPLGADPVVAPVRDPIGCAAQRPGCTTRSPWERAASARRAS